MQVRDYWDSPQGGRYPMAWTIAVPRLELELQVDPVLEAQELRTSVRYWEGAVDVAGVGSGGMIDGRGYVELTGYARDEHRRTVDRPLRELEQRRSKPRWSP
jgi:predicted secreted hydrolase